MTLVLWSREHLSSHAVSIFLKSDGEVLDFPEESRAVIICQREFLNVGTGMKELTLERFFIIYEMRLLLRKGVESKSDKVATITENKEVWSVEGRILALRAAVIHPGVDYDITVGFHAVVVGLGDCFFEIFTIHSALDEDGSMIFFSIAEKGDVVEVFEWIEFKDPLDVGDLVIVILANLPDDDFSKFRFTKLFEVKVEIPLGIAGDAGVIELPCLEEGAGEEAEEKESFHIHGEYAVKVKKVTGKGAEMSQLRRFL